MALKKFEPTIESIQSTAIGCSVPQWLRDFLGYGGEQRDVLRSHCTLRMSSESDETEMLERHLSSSRSRYNSPSRVPIRGVRGQEFATTKGHSDAGRFVSYVWCAR
jgi:hypothetical protein